MPQFLKVGTKTLSIIFRSVKVICSLSFLPFGLDKFAKTFDLIEGKKGFFPHLFNLTENQNYIGEFPDKKYYQPDFMSVAKKNEFELWYQKASLKQNGEKSLFNFKNEIRAYCASDVSILKRGLLEFRKIIMKSTISEKHPIGIDPFLKCITLASLCSYIYTTTFMPPNSIAIIPKNGYSGNDKTSRKAMIWLKFISESQNKYIKHSKNGGEVSFGNYKVDGFCEETAEIFEFDGCLFHGHLSCYKPDTFVPFLQTSIIGLNARHNRRKQFLENCIFNGKKVKIVSIYECEWEKLCKTDLNLKNFLKNKNIVSSLNPSDALSGGRTESFRMYHKVDETKNETLDYYDVTSLYPTVQKYCEYPTCHPEIITENFKDISSYFGLAKVTILPPKNLYFPVLPVKTDQKLLFCLCQKCAKTKEKNCNCSDQDRALEGTWVILEILEALKHGYKIIQIHEVWHFPTTSKYDPKTRTGGLFTEYINTFTKIKQESSGYPNWVKTEDDKNKYIQEYFEKQGILLEKSKIIYNEGLRTVAKLILNSLWGRLAMRTDKPLYKLITNPAEWFLLISDDENIVHSADFTHKDYLQVYYSKAQNMSESTANINVVLACFVTAHARIKMHREFIKIGSDRVCYTDTDSIIFTSKPNDYKPYLSSYLGDFTNEIDPKNGNITCFATAGPKNYTYETSTGYKKALVKGISLNNVSVNKINFESMVNIVTKDRAQIIETEQIKFSRNKCEWTNSTNIIKKKYRFFYDKRIILDDYNTLPFGY